MTSKIVRKRDGTVQSWDRKKIERAMFSAFNDADPNNIPNITELTEQVEKEISQLPLEQYEIETIQDTVEKVLMEKYPEVARIYIRYRSKRAEVREQRKDPDPSAISDYIHAAKYASDGGTEVFEKTVARTEQMHLKKYRTLFKDHPDFMDQIHEAHEAVKEKKIRPSSRSMQFAGKAIERTNARCYNCATSHINRLRVFGETFHMLLCGCGVGYSVQYQHVEQLPEVIAIDKSRVKHYIIEDSIEGWADSLNELIRAYFITGEYVEFGFHQIRKEGAPLSTGGVAPGHIPLKVCLDKVRGVLELARGRKLRPVEVHDIICFIAEAVLSGGIRRSALACIFSAEDSEMMYCKAHGNFRPASNNDPGINSQRQMANNSAMLLRDKVDRVVFDRLMRLSKEWGEPGFVFTDDLDFLFNPCVTKDTHVTTSIGLNTVENLIDRQFDALVNGSIHKSTAAGFWKTGFKSILKLKFKSGRELKLTPNHKLMTPTGWTEAGKLETGSAVTLHNHRNSNIKVSEDQNYARGYLLGNVLSDGHLDLCEKHNSAHAVWWGEDKDYYKADAIRLLELAGWDNNYPRTTSSNGPKINLTSIKLREFAEQKGCISASNTKCMSDKTICGPWNYLAGLVAGYFDGDGTVCVNTQKGNSARFTSVDNNNLRLLQTVLNAFGIYSVIYSNRLPEGERLLPDSNGKLKNYPCKEAYELHLSSDNIERFLKFIPIRNIDKKNKLQTIVNSRRRQPNRSKFEDTIVSITELPAEDVYDCTVPGPHAFDANGIYTHNCYEAGMWPILANYSTIKRGIKPMVDTSLDFDYKKKIDPDITDSEAIKLYGNRHSWQVCVSGETKLILKNGIVEIKDAVGKEVQIWNGSSWCKVIPFQTASDQQLMRVHLGDGSFLDCTPDHKWLVKDRFMKDYVEVKTKDIMKTSKYVVHTPPPNVVCDEGVKEEFAYEYGYALGDATCQPRNTGKQRTPFAGIFGTDRNLGLRGKLLGPYKNSYGTQYHNIMLEDLDTEFTWQLKYADGLPKDVFHWDKESVREFIAGWIDSDGTPTEYGFRIYGREDKIRDLQLLLTKYGVYSSVNLMALAGEKTNMATRRQDVWYIQVSNPKTLYSRKHSWKQRSSGTPFKGKWQTIKSVELLPGLHDTFCLTEENKHTCLFNNVITKQCNLTEINVAAIDSAEELVDMSKKAALIGTLQAGYTDFPYLGPVAERIIKREALLGVGLTGIMDNPEIGLNPVALNSAAKAAVKENERVAKIMGINPAARVTVIKPSGTASLALGNVSSGIHYHHARRYFRRVTANPNESVAQHFMASNPHMVEKKPNGDLSIIFPTKAPDDAKTVKEENAIEFLGHVLTVYENWVRPGSATRRNKLPLTHNVSATVALRDHEWEEAIELIWDNRDRITAMSFLPIMGDKLYPFAPREEVTSEADEVKWNHLIANYKPVDYSKMEGAKARNLAIDPACAGGACEI